MGDPPTAVAIPTVIFHEPKSGAPDSEWEDCAGHVDADPRSKLPARFVVVDGATEAFDSIRWVGQLVGSFLGADGPADLRPDELERWFGLMQRRWVDDAPSFTNVFEEHKFHEYGSFATFLACEIHGLGGPRPRWYAAALGDAVLFHVRGGRLIGQLPDLEADAFGVNPEGVFTQPSQLPRMRKALCFRDGPLEPGDVLFLATDALAELMVRRSRDGRSLWGELAGIDHPLTFRQWVADARDADGMKNDDVTLLRAEVTASGVEELVVCRSVVGERAR
jgi:hypothetical protein